MPFVVRQKQIQSTILLEGVGGDLIYTNLLNHREQYKTSTSSRERGCPSVPTPESVTGMHTHKKHKHLAYGRYITKCEGFHNLNNHLQLIMH